MATASAVPETYGLQGDDARATLGATGFGRLVKDSFIRFRTGDGFSNARAVAHAITLTAFPALIMVIGIASAFDLGTFRQVLQSTIQSLAPGPAGNLLQEAFRQGSSGGGALFGGLLGVLVSGTFAMALMERGCNRIYGMVRDRKFWKKVGVGLVVNVTAGTLMALAFLLLAMGGALGDALTGSAGWSDTAGTVFSVLRWPLGLVLAFAALTVVYKVSPNRRQPSGGWLQVGTVVATILWFALTALLAWYYGSNSSLGDTYGPLVGIIALLTWANATGVAVLFGMAFAAQLEAVRAGVPGPRTLRRHNEVLRRPEESSEYPAGGPLVLLPGSRTGEAVGPRPLESPPPPPGTAASA